MSIVTPPLSGDPPSAVGTLSSGRAIGSLWRRIVAVAVDGIIVGIAGIVIGLPFFETFSRLGPWGRLVGFSIALPYFAILNSSIGNGQTLGKRWMHLQVVDLLGNTISLWKSVFRYVLLAVPYFLDGIALPVTRTPWIVSSLISFVIFAVGGATFYLVCFNRHTRQGIHDLAVGSYVAEVDQIGPLKTQPIWKMHWVILGSLLVVFSSAARILESKLAKWQNFPQMLQDARAIESVQGVQRAGVQDMTDWSGGDKKKIFVVSVLWTGKSADQEAFADGVAKLILRDDSSVEKYDLLRLVVIRGYDLGIGHAQVSHAF